MKGSKTSYSYSDLSLDQLLDFFSRNIDTNNCLVNCSRNGLCSFSQIDSKVVCSCYQFYAGPACSIDTRPCSSNPCLNEGMCIQNLTNPNEFSYHCDCGLFYEGSLCEYKRDVCKNETCSGNGNCVDFNNSPKCICFSSYEGESCESIKDYFKIRKIIVKATTIIAICVLVCFYLIFLLMDLHRIFFIKKKVITNSLKWNHRILRQNYNLKNKKNNSKRKNAVGITYLDYIE